LDDSSNARHADMVNFSDGITNPVSRRPRLAASFLRDRCLYFDGGDIVELNKGGGGPDQFNGVGYAISMWLAPDAVPTSSQVLLSKDSVTGGDLFKFSMEPTTHRLAFDGGVFNLAGTPRAGWQHLLVNCSEDDSGNSTFFLYRNGVLIGLTDSSSGTPGNVTGKPWSIGAEWISSNTTGNGFQGSMDDVALFQRTLTEAEIRQLAAKSPLYGLHEAEMVVRSGSEGGERRINLRANVAPAAEFITLRTEPDGLPIQVDGVNFTSPVSFAVVHSASSQPGAREWVEGSSHRITALASHTSPNAAGSVKYDFHEWSGGGGREFFLTAQRVGATFTATYAPGVIVAPGVAEPPARSSGSTILQGLAGSPKGPFLRITNGNLTLPNLGANGFAISGDLYLSSQRFQGRISSTALNLPATGTSRFLEVGAANWSVDATAGGPFELTARPPSVRLIGYDAIPEGQVKLAFTPAAGANPAKWLAEFQLLRDFKPVPDMIEFRKGRARVEWLATTGPPAFALELNGGIRILKTPSGSFALSEAVNLRFDTVNFDLSLNQALANAGITPPVNLVQTGPFRIGWGDVRLRRSNGGPVAFAVTDFPFDFNSATVATVSGSLNTAGELALIGGLPAAGALLLDPSGNLRLRSPSGTSSFQMTVNSQPSPRLRLSTPSLRLETTGTNADLLPNGITIPGLEIDTAGAFDTGKLPLPAFNSLNFDGISVSGPALGDRDENHLRLRRDALGEVTFNAKSQQDFLGDLQNLSVKLRVAGGSLSASGSIYGRFVLLPEPISLNYDSSQPCQFSSSAFGFTVFFGTGCAGVKVRDPSSGNQVTVIGNVP
ncbi:MAG: LamG-like jellyroll fold domain-containing protein, partial [Luteolibacter sp.]